MKLDRACWQVGVTRLRDWMNFIKSSIEDIQTYSSVDESGVRIALAGDDRKLDVNDFIKFMGTKGASVSALQSGQTLIAKYISEEMPAITLAGAAGWGMGIAILLGMFLFWWLKK
jgi:hypothetical protein